MKHVDNLSKTLQRSTVSAAEGQRVAAPTLTTLEKIRTDEDFDLIWKLVQKKASHFDISEPKLPHKRKAPKRFVVGSGESHFPQWKSIIGSTIMKFWILLSKEI